MQWKFQRPGLTVARSANSREDESRRWLCSHVVQLVFDGGRFPSNAALLEEIEAESAAIGVESPYPVGTSLKLEAGDFKIPAQIILLLPRETDFLIWVQFSGDRRWDPETWKPDHLYLPPKPKKKIGRAAGQGR